MYPKGIWKDKNILVIYSNTNVGKKKDATGAFIPEAEAFQRMHGIPDENMVGVKCPRVPKHKRRAKVYKAIERVGKKRTIDAIAFFGHGWPQGIQFGIGKGTIKDFCSLLGLSNDSGQPYCSDKLIIVLYACLAAENNDKNDNRKIGPGTNGGFADELRDELNRFGFSGHVDAHLTAGHTDWNPFLIRFVCESWEDDLCGGSWIIQPRSALWKKWVKLLKSNTGFRLRFPFMKEEEIVAEVASS
jgi:hypothetical protein